MTQSVCLQRWSTDSEAPRHRLDLYAALLSSLQVPMKLSAPRQADFEAHVTAADLGAISVVQQRGTPHRSRGDEHGLRDAQPRSYHLLLSPSMTWDAEHRGAHRCEPGDVMLFDTALPWKISHARHYEIINIKLHESWLRQWVPFPAHLVGRPIRARDGWGRALAGFATQLRAEFFVHAPLPHSVVIDHLGALLALCASPMPGPAARPVFPARDALAARLADCVEQRCGEPGLTAEQVAQACGISVRTLHRCLAAEQRTFGSALIAARSDAAIRMLSSPVFRRLTLAEIARRAGFTHATHFSRVLRARTGKTPSELRRSFGTADREDVLSLQDGLPHC